VVVVLIAALRGPSLPPDRFVSVSAPPEQGPDHTPFFTLCDSIPCSCACDDPYDPRLKAPADGPFAGQCLNTRLRRSAKRIEPDEAARRGYYPEARADDGRLYMVNVYHADSLTGRGSFYVARVDTARLRDVVVQVEHAGGIQGHGQFRFRFTDVNAVRLVPQRTDLARCTIEVADLFYSVEAQAPAGIPYKGDYGFRRHYVQTHRLATMAARARVMIKLLHRPVRQYALDPARLSPAAVFTAALTQSSTADPHERYHTTRNNCVLKLYRILDRVSPPAWYRRPLLWLTDQTLFMPTRAPRHLRYRNLLATEQPPNMEVELGWEEFVKCPSP
jgi:hypothetical protein